jgi:GTP-binding protein
VVGLEQVDIGDTLADPANPNALPPVKVDEPTLDMVFRINDGPFVGKDGQYVTSRQVRDRLERELQSNVALRVKFEGPADEWHVSGRGLMHLGILLENMRREGYEMTVGKPHVIFHEEDGKKLEPMERLVVECPENAVSAVMNLLSDRKANMEKLEHRGQLTVLNFDVPARGLIGLRSRMLTATQGEAVMYHTFDRYDEFRGPIPGRSNGVMIASESGQSPRTRSIPARPRQYVRPPGDQVYEGQIVGEHCDTDIPVNVCRQEADQHSFGQQGSVTTLKGRARSRSKPPWSTSTTMNWSRSRPRIRLRKRLLKEADRRREAAGQVTGERLNPRTSEAISAPAGFLPDRVAVCSCFC